MTVISVSKERGIWALDVVVKEDVAFIQYAHNTTKGAFKAYWPTLIKELKDQGVTVVRLHDHSMADHRDVWGESPYFFSPIKGLSRLRTRTI